MATVVKDFKVKAGLVVEGTTATVNGKSVLKKNDATDEAYIVGLVTGGGGTASTNTADTVVLRDGTGSFAAGTITAETGFVGDLEGDVTGNADTATALASSVNISVSGDATGSVSFDGSGDAEIVVTLDSSFATDSEVATAKSEAISTAASDATTKANAAQTAAESFATAADTTLYGTVTTDIATAKGEAESFATAADTTLYGTVTTDIATAKSEAISTAASDATTKANAAEASANSYTDLLVGDNTIDGTSGNTIADRIDSAVAGIVDGAPELLDTLNELAAAIGDNPDTISNLQDLAAGKQNALTAGSNIDITSDVISVTGLDSNDISDFESAAITANTGLWDEAGSAASAQTAAEEFATSADTTLYGNVTSDIATAKAEAGVIAQGYADTAETNAKDYASGLVNDLEITVGDLTTDDVAEGTSLYFTDVRAKASAADLITNATKTNITITGDENGLTITAENGVADSTTDDLTEGSSNLYFTDARAVEALEAVVPNFDQVDVNSVATQVAATVTASTAGIQNAYSFSTADYRSAKFLVQVKDGTHSDVSEVLITTDSSDNIAITEYAIVGTNGSMSSITAVEGALPGTVVLQVTTANNNSVITVMGTLLV